MTPEVDAQQGAGFWGIVTTAVIGIGLSLYSAWRSFRKDRVADQVDEKSQRLIDNLTGQLLSANDKCLRLEDAIDRIAKERNEAVQNLGRFEERLRHMEDMITHLRDDNQKLRSEVTALRAENAALVKEIAGLRGDFARFGVEK